MSRRILSEFLVVSALSTLLVGSAPHLSRVEREAVMGLKEEVIEGSRSGLRNEAGFTR